MKVFLRNANCLVLAGFIATFSAAVAAAQCDAVITGANASCYLTHEDEQFCHYDCYCTGTREQCDQFCIENGLS